MALRLLREKVDDRICKKHREILNDIGDDETITLRKEGEDVTDRDGIM